MVTTGYGFVFFATPCKIVRKVSIGCAPLIEPYPSIEAAISSWPTTATCIGVRMQRDDLIVYAPYGLNDLFDMIARPNKVQITEAIYIKKVDRWKTCWPKLQIIPW